VLLLLGNEAGSFQTKRRAEMLAVCRQLIPKLRHASVYNMQATNVDFLKIR